MIRLFCFCFLVLLCFSLWPENFSLSGSVTGKLITSIFNKNSSLLTSNYEYEIENYLLGNFELTFLPQEKSFAYYNLDCKIAGMADSKSQDIIQSIEDSINEAYLSLRLSEYLFLNIGKKRIVWGVAYFENPSDFINPVKDPVDPDAERRGVYCTELELIFYILSINQVVVLYDDLNYFGYGTKLSTSALIPATDINIAYYYSLNKLHNIGFSVDTTPFGDSSIPVLNELALHCEIGMHQTSEYYEIYIDPISGMPATRQKSDSDNFYFHIVGGLRMIIPYLQTFITAEYIYREDGYSSDEFKNIIKAGQVFFIDYYASKQGRHTLAVSITQPQLSSYFWEFTDTLAFTTVWIINLYDLSSLLHVELESSLIPGVSITLSGGVNFGALNSEFGIMPHSCFIGGQVTLCF